jgi:hypothetical protein
MGIRKNVIQIWKNKGQILEGITNSIFKKEDVEEIAKQRMAICRKCYLYDIHGAGCTVPKTAPCCNAKHGGCGCSLSLKTRSLSSDCPLNKWKAILSEDEEDKLKEKLGL